jgi:FkbM family methyltransferase
MLNSLQDLLTSRLHGVPRSELRFARQLVDRSFFTQCDGVLDVGANRGMFCTAMTLAAKGIPIHAFEPLPTLHMELSCRISRFPKIELHKCGLGATLGVADLNHGAFHEASSLLPMDERHKSYFPGSQPTGKVSVAITTLDVFFQQHPELKRVFLKLDVQGYELEVMKGAVATFDRIYAVMVEISFEELYKGGATAEAIMLFFLNHGFRSCGFVRPLMTKNNVFPISGDFVFARRL